MFAPFTHRLEFSETLWTGSLAHVNAVVAVLRKLGVAKFTVILPRTLTVVPDVAIVDVGISEYRIALQAQQLEMIGVTFAARLTQRLVFQVLARRPDRVATTAALSLGHMIHVTVLRQELHLARRTLVGRGMVVAEGVLLVLATRHRLQATVCTSPALHVTL